MDWIEVLLQSTPKEGYAPTDRQFEFLERIDIAHQLEDLCDAIFSRYNSARHDRHVMAMIFSMLRWFSPKHDEMVHDYMKEWADSDDIKKVGVLVSPVSSWFPFGDKPKTKIGMQKLKKRFPQFSADCDCWIGLSSGKKSEIWTTKGSYTPDSVTDWAIELLDSGLAEDWQLTERQKALFFLIYGRCEAQEMFDVILSTYDPVRHDRHLVATIFGFMSETEHGDSLAEYTLEWLDIDEKKRSVVRYLAS